MKNKLYWGLGILIVLLIGAFVFVMVNEYAENDQIEAESKETENLADSNNHREAENRPPPPGKSFEGGGHWHGDEWHDAPHEPTEQAVQPIVKTIESDQAKKDKPLGYICPFCNCNHDELTLEEAKQCRRDYEAGYLAKYGVNPPPVGAKWRHFFDKNGNAHVLYPGEVTVINVDTKIGFAPTKEQFDRYQQLKQNHRNAVREKRHTDAKTIAEEIRQLKAQAQGKIPVGAFVLLDADISMSKERQKELQIQAAYKAQRDAYIEMGLTHIMPNHLRNIQY